MRRAVERDLSGLVDLKVAWADRPDEGEERVALASALREWIGRSDVVCVVADEGGRLVGMAWMVVFPRVPNLGDTERYSADLQSVLVLAPHRRRGIGRRLIAKLCDLADDRGIRGVTVQSNLTAKSVYMSEGFLPSGLLLERISKAPMSQVCSIVWVWMVQGSRASRKRWRRWSRRVVAGRGGR
mgnify:FL=1